MNVRAEIGKKKGTYSFIFLKRKQGKEKLQGRERKPRKFPKKGRKGRKGPSGRQALDVKLTIFREAPHKTKKNITEREGSESKREIGMETCER